MPEPIEPGRRRHRPRRRAAAGRIGRGAHRLLAWLGSIAAALILVAGFGLWRLMQGPIQLDRLTPYVQQALNQSAEGLHIAISGVRFGVDRDTRQLDLWLEGVHLSRSDGEPFAAFPAMSASFSLRSLVRGSLAPTRLVVERPVLRLIRQEDGTISLRIGERDLDAPSLGPEILEQAAGPAKPEAPLGLLRRVVLRDATLVLDDRRTGRRWQADRVDAAVERDPQGLAGDLSLAVAIGAGRPELHASYRYSAADRTLDLAVEIGAVEPAALAALVPELAPLAAVDFPVSGTLTTRLDLAGSTAEGIRVDLGFGKGSLKSELLPEGALAVQQGELHAVYAPETSQLRLVRLGLDLGGGSVLTVKGSLDGVTPALVVGNAAPFSRMPGELHIALVNVPVVKFESLWPRVLSPGGRRWVLANIHDGVLDEAAVRLDIEVDPAARSAEVTAARGSMRYRDLTINYLDGLPPARKVSGTATLAGKTLGFTPSGGMVKSVHVTGGSLDITNLGAPVEWLAIDLALAGPLQDVIEIIDAKPLHYAHDIGIDPAGVAGRTETNLHFKLPLLREVRLDEVEYGAKARLTGVAIANIAMGRGLDDGNFTLEITRPGLRLEGQARFDSVPSTIDASLTFKPKSGPRARYHIAATLDDEQRRRLGWDYFPDRLSGPVGVDFVYLVLDAGRAEAQARLDLRRAALSVAEAGWHKPPDAPATASLVLDLADEKVSRLRRIEVKAPELDARLALALMPDGRRIGRIEIERLVIAGDDVAGVLVRQSTGGWRADLRGSRLDLSYWVNGLGKEDLPQPAAASPPLSIDARIGRLIVGPAREVRDVSAQLSREGDNWQSARVDARLVNGRQLRLRFGGGGGDRHSFHFFSDDLGATLSLLGVGDNIVGGRVSVTGQVSDKPGKPVVRGHIEGENYNLVRAPGFARVLSLASLSAVGSMLAGSGIPFTTLRGDFGYSGGRLVLDTVLAYGGAIGVTANGTIELGRDRLDLQGTIVPAYTLNSIIGNIPVIGSLLLGGEGQGLFAANFSLTGSSDDPRISVNPLSALAPGFLRRLFQPNFGLSPPIQESLGVQ